VIVKETTPRPKVHLAAVGPTTARFLEGEEHLRVDAVAPKPNAESLATTLRAFEDADTLQQQS
jgi:uroporphyrinogen-III synthase